MLRALALVMLLLVAGCSSSSGHPAAKHITTSPSPSPSVAPITPSPTPNGPAAALPISSVSFSCRLPVTTLTYGAESMTYQGGYIDFPSGVYVADSSGTMNFNHGTFVTQQAPVLYGSPDGLTPPFFDAAAGRWLPVSADEAAPDGLSYASVTASDPSSGTATISVVDVRLGTQRSYHVAIPDRPGAQGIRVMDDDGAGVYFVVGQIDQTAAAGVWRLDLATGKVSPLAQVANVVAVRAGYAWAGLVDPHDPTPPKLGGISLFDTIVAVNLRTGALTNWYYTLGRSTVLIGFASGDRPIASVSSAPDFIAQNGETRLIDQPNTSAEDNGELVSPPGLRMASPQADGDRTWFSGTGGIYLYTSAGGLQRVFAGGDNPKLSGGQIEPAGFCR